MTHPAKDNVERAKNHTDLIFEEKCVLFTIFEAINRLKKIGMPDQVAETKSSLPLEWVTIKSQSCLQVNIRGHFTNSNAIKAASEWKKMFDGRPNKKFAVIFNCKEMKDYEPLARGTWQTAISAMKPQISSIWVISDSKIIAAGAAIMGLFTSYSIKTVGTVDKVVL